MLFCFIEELGNESYVDFFAGQELEETPIIIADVGNSESLAEMCKQAKVVLNCIGPVSSLPYEYLSFS